MESLLRKTDSWKPFYDMCLQLVSKRRADKKDLLWLLQYVDPAASFQVAGGWNWFKALVLGSGFESGRKLLYWNGFQKFVSKNSLEFDGAPLKVIQQFNKLVLFLFGQSGTKLFIDEAFARDGSNEMRIKRLQLLAKARRKTDEMADAVNTPQPPSEKIEEKLVLDHPLLIEYQGKTYSPTEKALLLHGYVLIKQLHTRLLIDTAEARSKLQNRYPDLVNKIGSSDEPFPRLTCSLENLEAEITSIFHTRRKHLTDCINEAHERDTLIQQVDELVEAFIVAVSRFSQYKDLKEEVDHIKTRFESERVLKAELAKGSGEDLSVLLERKKRFFHEMMNAFQNQFSKLCSDADSIEKLRAFTECALLIRLNGVFSGKIPYPDELDSLTKVQADFKLRTMKAIDEVSSGRLTVHQFAILLNNLCYDHDLLRIRKENSYRAKRLKDFREEVLGLRLESYRLNFFSDLFGPVNVGLIKLYDRLSNPFVLFEGVREMEDVSRVMRSLWIEYEALQVEFEDAKEKGLKDNHEIASFLDKLFDDLEHVAHAFKDEKVSLVATYRIREASCAKLITIMKEIELHFPFASPLLNWRVVSDPLERRKKLIDLYRLELQKRHVIDLAKRAQALIVHEEERIDQILELFEGWGKEQGLNGLMESRLKTLQLVSEELYFYFMSLDSRALMIRDIKEEEHVRHELQQLLPNKTLLELFWSRMYESSSKDQYAFYMTVLHRAQALIDRVEQRIFDSQTGVLPDWVTAYVPACRICKNLIQAAMFEKLDSRCIQELFTVIRENLKSAPKESMRELDTLEAEKTPPARNQNIFFSAGVINRPFA